MAGGTDLLDANIAAKRLTNGANIACCIYIVID